ncbi:MAG: MobF family relaxase [Acidimicrobiia bacterium]
MLVSITPLGSVQGDADHAATQVVGYLEGKVDAGRRIQAHRSPGVGVGAYYADSVEGPGRWSGRGAAALGLEGTVDAQHLQDLLVGRRPGTGEQLLDATGSAARARCNGDDPHPLDPDREIVGLAEATRVAGVSKSYLHRIIVRTQQDISERVRALFTGAPLPSVPATYLLAHRDGPRAPWRIERRELERYLASRQPRRAVIGYDVTFSAPKSVSVLWATASPQERYEIVAATHAAVDAGITYLESVTSIQGSDRPPIRGLAAAAFTHATSRNLDPQLHVHTVIANLVETLDGRVRAVDGRDLFAHAKTAGYLAAAELRHQTARRLGWQWGPVVHGLADVVGVPTEALAVMSSRRREIDSLAAEIGIHSAAGRQIAAYQSRAAKAATDPDTLRADWQQRLTAVGFDADTAAACFGRQLQVPLVTDPDRQALMTNLASARGVTEQAAVFDRRDVIQAVASWAGDRLVAHEIQDLADDFLASEHAVPLTASRQQRSADVIRLRGGRVVTSVAALTLYSTPTMLGLEAQVLDAFHAGLDRGSGTVPAPLVEAALAVRPSIGKDQAAMVRAICTSGDQFQCVIGPAGSGKTFALDAARDAWQRAGYAVLGAADQGTAAEVLGRGAGVRAETLEYWLTVLDSQSDPASVLGPRTVMLVDEASTAGTRSLARLFAHARRTGATIRLVGDPAQHSAVTAGGGFRDLTRAYPERTPTLTELRRQAGPELAELRLALTEYRGGQVAESVDRLLRDDRFVLADTADELLDKLTTDWWLDRQARRADPTRASSSMVAEHHRERRALNDRARIMLDAAGELSGPGVEAAGQEFRAGDEVICRTPAKDLHPAGRTDRYVRNGTRGTVIAVRTDTNGDGAELVVDFEGRGPVHVPYEFLTRELRPGVNGGLTHSYALTSYAAQGQTHETGRTLATDGSSRPAVYVGLTRGRSDTRVYAVRRRDLLANPEAEDHMPRLEDEKAALEAVTDRLIASGHEQLASILDPHAAAVAELRAGRALAELVNLHKATSDADPARHRTLARAVRAEADAVALRAQTHPDPELVARLGERPPSGPDRRTWDTAVAAHAIHHALAGAVLDPQLDLPRAGKVAVRLRNAEIVALARQPTANLAREAHGLTRDLLAAGPGCTSQLRHHSAALARAEHALAIAEHAEATAEQRLDRAHHERGAVAAQATEAARRQLDGARHKRAAAAFHRDQLAARLDLVIETPDAADHAAARLERLRAALDQQAARAVERTKTASPNYTLQLLGPRPSHGAAATAWDKRVTELERYRHHHGYRLDEAAAPVDAPAEYRALGPRPADAAAAFAWDTTLATLRAPLEPRPAIAVER